METSAPWEVTVMMRGVPKDDDVDDDDDIFGNDEDDDDDDDESPRLNRESD